MHAAMTINGWSAVAQLTNNHDAVIAPLEERIQVG
jgi:hypothetical protein